MNIGAIGRIDSVWRYPVKSMAGESLDEGYLGFSGVRGDRLFAFRSSKAPEEFPYFTAREQSRMLHFRPRFRQDDLEVETPTGQVLAIDDPGLISMLVEGMRDTPDVTLMRSDSAIADCHPISVFALQTARAIGDELGLDVDKRRFRANLYVDLDGAGGFAEDNWVGRRLRIGEQAEISILERDARCKLITIDPETTESNPAILRPIAQDHEGKAGVYAEVVVEGTVRPGDGVEVLD